MRTIDEKRKMLKTSYFGFLKKYSTIYPKEPFLYKDNEMYTFKDTCSIVMHVASFLKENGISKGDYILVEAVKDPKTAIIFIALSLLNAIIIPLDTHEKPSFIIDDFSSIQIKAIISNQNDLFFLNFKDRKIKLTFERCSKIEEHIADELNLNNDINSPSLLLFTSGSTGKRKAVLLSQQNYLANSIDGGGLFDEDISIHYLCVLPLHHMFGFAQIVCSTVNGHSIRFADCSIQEIKEEILNTEVNVIYAVPTYYLSLIKEIPNDFEKLKYGLIAAGPSSDEQILEIENKLKCPLIPVYGMSEFAGLTSLTYEESKRIKKKGVGKPYPLNDLKIINDNDEEVKYDEIGEVIVKGPDLMIGYLKNDLTIDDARDENGYFHTGDLAIKSKDGIIHVTGRIKDIIIKGGENISTRKIELALLSLNYIDDCIVTGIKDEFYGEIPVALVTLKEYKSENDIILDLKLLIKKNEIPKIIKIVSSLPLTSSLKHDKIKAREYFL